jgi:hypothetical protein
MLALHRHAALLNGGPRVGTAAVIRHWSTPAGAQQADCLL